MRRWADLSVRPYFAGSCLPLFRAQSATWSALELAKRDSFKKSDQPEQNGVRWTGIRRSAIRCAVWTVSAFLAALIAGVSLLAVADPPFTAKMAAHYVKTGSVTHESVDLDSLPRHMPLAFIAAEDSGFCRHWGFDLNAIRASETGGGASISQQTARNLFLWRGENGFLRLLESVAAGVIELVLSKRRILEIYLNTNEYSGGVYGVAAAAKTSFGKVVSELDDEDSALLAARFSGAAGAAEVTDDQRKRAETILEGARLLSKDDRSACIGG